MENSICDQTFPSFTSRDWDSPGPTPPTKYTNSPVQQQQSTPLREHLFRSHQRAYSTPQSAFSSDNEQAQSYYNNNNESPARNIMRHQNSSDAIRPSIRPSPHVSPRMQHSDQDLRREYHREPEYSSNSARIQQFTDNDDNREKDVFASESAPVSAEKQFSDLMNSMQIPESIRQKMLALDPSVKMGMLTSPPSALSAFLPAQLPNGSSSNSSKRVKGKHTSKAKSSSSLFFALPKRNTAVSESNIVTDISSKKTIEKLNRKDKDMQSPPNFAMLLRSKRLNTITEHEVKKVRIVLRTAGVAWLQEWERLVYCFLG